VTEHPTAQWTGQQIMMGIALGSVVGQVINFGVNLYIRSQGGTTERFYHCRFGSSRAQLHFRLW
jgi:hypothetical protein